ncbi:unnamed protein product [Symbiodinium sp. CCMP2592]|nr:unnamed protein product [Symbiodinium sp. CCMP2592]
MVRSLVFLAFASAKGWWWQDFKDSLKKAGNAVADTFEEIGVAVGSAASNAIIVVENQIVQPVKAAIEDVPAEVVNVANQIGTTAVQVGQSVEDFGEVVAETAVTREGDIRSEAEAAVNQGVSFATTMANEIGNKATSLAHNLGDGIKKLGPLVTGFAQDVWNAIEGFLSCVVNQISLCEVLIGDQCDCSAGSFVTVTTNDFRVKCVLQQASEFTRLFETQASTGLITKLKNGKLKLPGQNADKNKKGSGVPLRSRGSCDTTLDMAFEGAVQFEPTLEVKVATDGSTEYTISGLVRASFDAFVSAEGSCAVRAERRFPTKPKKKVICGSNFCLVLLLQMLAEVEIQGSLTGTVDAGAAVDVQVQGTVTVNPNGQANAEFETPTIWHQEGFAIGASARASVRIGTGPVFTVWPMPGVPVTFNPMFHAEAKAEGTLSFQARSSQVLDGASSQPNQVQMCGAAARSLEFLPRLCSDIDCAVHTCCHEPPNLCFKSPPPHPRNNIFSLCPKP